MGQALPEVLEGLLRAVEAQGDHSMLTSILFRSDDGKHLHHGAAPSLPAAYNKAIHGIAIAEGAGSCGTVAHRGTPVYANDIASDPLWVDFRDLASLHKLGACWSTPIAAADGEVLGTFAIYYAAPRSPTQEDIEAIASITQTAALAIERYRSDLKLKRSEEALRALNANLELQVAERARALERAWRLSREMLAQVTPSGRIEAINPAWMELLGWEDPELVGRRFLDFIHPDDLGATSAAFAGALERPMANPLENRLRHKDGSYRWFSWTLAFENELYFVSGRHTTLERDQAEALRQSQKMEAVGQLTGGVAHDFNNLLTVIRSSTDLLQRPKLSEERRTRYIGAISDTVDRAAKLTGQLLAFARRQVLQPETFDVGQSVHQVTDMLKTLTGSRVFVDIQVAANCIVNADPSQFDTALVNMAVNARDAMHGEGRLTIRVQPVEAIPPHRLNPAIIAPFVAVSITDTGSGIPADQLQHIFEPFFTSKGVGQGTGLGLSQVFGFSKQSGGEVLVESVVGRGTVFTLYLPRVASIQQTISQSDPEVLIDGQGTCVLIVEDNVSVGAFAKQALDDLGYAAILANNSAEALSELARNSDKVDVVFTDVVMPGMDGIDLTGIIRRDYDDLPVVLTSGYNHVLADSDASNIELLQKPYSIEQLSRVLRKAVTLQRLKRKETCILGQD